MFGIGIALVGLSVFLAPVGVVLMISMTAAIIARGHRINWPLLRLQILNHIGLYRRVTLDESGRPGPPFYPFVVSMNTALVAAVIGLLVLSL